ncbi:MAG: N-acetylneuraminate synthase family protein [Candidatus Adiutrix sp.]
MKIGQQHLTLGGIAFITAEIGGNHHGDYALGLKMVEAAAKEGASGVKFQAYQTDKFLSPLNPSFAEMLAEEMPFEELAQLLRHAQHLSLAAGITVFDDDGLNLARDVKADFIKISSGDIDNFPLLEKAAETSLPLIVSTGAAYDYEVHQALSYLQKAAPNVILLQCTALYPSPPKAANLMVMETWLKSGLLAGYSDHTLGLDVAKAALAMGAVMVEKHFTIDKQLPGGDNAISMLPDELAELSRWAKLCPLWRGSSVKTIDPLESPMRPLIRRALVATCNLKAGHILTSHDVALKRPQMGGEPLLGPKDLKGVLGRRLTANINCGQNITVDKILFPQSLGFLKGSHDKCK